MHFRIDDARLAVWNANPTAQEAQTHHMPREVGKLPEGQARRCVAAHAVGGGAQQHLGGALSPPG